MTRFIVATDTPRTSPAQPARLYEVADDDRGVLAAQGTAGQMDALAERLNRGAPDG